ncbi:hypothetical protein GCM10022408_35310 [Hymenobacter fastidiosus]|uniref:Uncharacterized protein n=1 Tax=Hymenobacter fastidiosus TaxID=486264 RepID=A0ABP7SYZ7_9BACT
MNLIAVESENGIRQLRLGTEDKDAMAQRASSNDWMPQRPEAVSRNYTLQVTTIVADGLQAMIPPLEYGERFYCHYIIAENPRCKSADYPEEPDISTWYAVEQTKSRLERAWQEDAKNPRP